MGTKLQYYYTEYPPMRDWAIKNLKFNVWTVWVPFHGDTCSFEFDNLEDAIVFKLIFPNTLKFDYDSEKIYF